MYAHQQPTFTPPPVSPEKALASYVLGRWVLFILLGSLPALFMTSIPGIPGVIGLMLLAVPAYLAYRGQQEVREKYPLTRDANKTPLWLALGGFGLAGILNFAFSGTMGGNYSNASMITLSMIIAASIYGIRTLEVPARINPDAVDKKTRIAASTVAIFTGSLALTAVMSILVAMIAVTVGLALLFFLGGETGITLLILCGLPILTGIGTLIAGLRGRRTRIRARKENPALPNPILHKKEVILFSLAGSHFFLGFLLFFILFAAAAQTGTMMEQFQ